MPTVQEKIDLAGFFREFLDPDEGKQAAEVSWQGRRTTVRNEIRATLLPQVRATRIVNAHHAAVWDLLTDTSRWHEWGPSVRAVKCTDRRIQAGSSGRVLTVAGFWVPFEVTGYVPERYWSWSIHGIPATGHEVLPVGKHVCRLTLLVPFFAAPYVAVCRIAVNRIARIAEDQTRCKPA